MFLRMSEQTYDPTQRNNPEDGQSNNIHHDFPETYVNVYVTAFPFFEVPAKMIYVSCFT